MPRLNPQTSLSEKVVEDAELEASLERREALREARSSAARTFTEADQEARAMIAKLELGLGSAVRVGRFVVTLERRAGRSVSFETEPKDQLRITLADE